MADHSSLYSSTNGTKQLTAPTMQHIDRKELYTSLPARVRYLHSFLDFNSEDRAALQIATQYIKSLIPTVVDVVYKKLLSYDITARAFTTRSTSYEGPIDLVPGEESPQIKYRKMFLRGYLVRLCSDPTKMEFWEYMDKVGMMHVGQGRKHPLHVDYIHVGVLLGYLQDILTKEILGNSSFSLEVKTKVLRALGKILWIQNDLFAKWYVRDGGEFLNHNDEEEIDPEGYLYGKIVIGNGGAEVRGNGSDSTTGEGGRRGGKPTNGDGSHPPHDSCNSHIKLENGGDVSTGTGCPFMSIMGGGKVGTK